MQTEACVSDPTPQEVVPYTGNELKRRAQAIRAARKDNPDVAIALAVKELISGHPEVLTVDFVEELLLQRLATNPKRYSTSVATQVGCLARWVRDQPGFNSSKLTRVADRKNNKLYARPVRVGLQRPLT